VLLGLCCYLFRDLNWIEVAADMGLFDILLWLNHKLLMERRLIYALHEFAMDCLM